MTTIHLQVAPRVGPDNPRGSRFAAALFLGMWRAFAAVTALGRTTPPREKSPAEQAQAVREMALTHQHSDPRFAAELMAAADRHEQLHGLA
jgi:hypothetical protein